MSEKSFWTLVRNNLPFRCYRVENRVMLGMPDVHYVSKGKSGWIELKFVPKWPKKRINTGYRLQQAIWAREYIKNGGQSWILIRIERDFTALIHGKNSVELYNRPSPQDFRDMSVFYKRGNMDRENWAELAHTILNPLPSTFLA